MRKVLLRKTVIGCLCVLGFALAQVPSQVSAQTPFPPPPPILTNLPPIFTNLPPVWTNLPPIPTNPPPVWTNLPPVWWTNPPPPPPLGTNPPPDWTNQPPVWTNVPPVITNLPPVWTNIWHGFTNIFAPPTNQWWTNTMPWTNPAPPMNPTNGHSKGVVAQTSSTAGPPNLPSTAQALVQQFQQQRNQLVSSLSKATGAQRQAILQQLEQVRQQLQDQLGAYQAQLRDQLSDMQKQYSSRFAPGNTSSGGPGSPTHGGRPRN